MDRKRSTGVQERNQQEEDNGYVTLHNAKKGIKSLKGSAVISNDGGDVTIEGTDVRLTIRPNAFQKDEQHEITLEIVQYPNKYEEVSFNDNSTVTVNIQPQLSLKSDAVLHLPHCLVLQNISNCNIQVFQSHLSEGRNPIWEDISKSVRHVMEESSCDIFLSRLCTTKYIIRGNVTHKRIVLYAMVEHCTNDAKRVAIQVGYILDLPGSSWVFKCNINKKEVSSLQSFLFRNSKKDLKIRLSGIDPTNWKLSEQYTPESAIISYFDIKCSNEQYVPFYLERHNLSSDLPRCVFRINQGNYSSTTLPVIIKAHYEISNQNSTPQTRPQQALQPTMRNRKPTQKEILNISKEIDEWKFIARNLQITENDIRNISSKHESNRERAYQMLHFWMETKARAATIDVLCEALNDDSRQDLAEKLCAGSFQ